MAVVSLALVFGCTSVDTIAKSLTKPTAEVTGVKLQNLSLDSATLLFDVKVTNPYAVSLPLVNVDYDLASEGEQILKGQADLQSTIPARKSATVSIPAEIGFLGLLRTLQHFSPGAIIPYEAALGLSVDAPGTGPIRLPVNTAGELPIPAVPKVKIDSIEWGQLSLNSAEGVVRLAIENQNEFPIDLSNLTYALNLGDVEVASATLRKSMSFAKEGGAGTIEIPVSFKPSSLGLALFRMLGGSSAEYMFQGEMDVTTPYGELPLPVSSVGKLLMSKRN